VVAEHIVMGPDVSGYPWGRFPLRPDDPFLEPTVLLSAIAASTTQLRLATGILIAALRPVPLLAKQVATLDQLSGGRLELGVGTGWHAEELAAHGLDPAERGRLLTDTIRGCRALWSDQPATVETSSFAFGPVYCHPTPTRPGGPPVLFSGRLTARNRRRIAELGDGWIPIMGATALDITGGIEQLRRDREGAGRDGEELRVRMPLELARGADGMSLERTFARRDDVPAGVTDVTIPVAAFVRDEAGVERFFSALAALLATG
jgi:probable F420-dependent oxidoreductase